ncbi:unnamed protein product, partial [marine sediment metagenome]
GRGTGNDAIPPAVDGRGNDDFNKAEYTQKTQRLAELDKQAVDMGYKDANEYQAALEGKFVQDQFVDEALKVDDKPVDPPPETPPEEPKATPEPSAVEKRLKDLEEQSLKTKEENFKTEITTMQSDYINTQNALPDEQKFGYTIEELNTFLSNKRNSQIALGEVMDFRDKGKYSNVYQVAAEMMSTQRGRTEAFEKGVDSQQALNNAAESSRLLGTTGTPPLEPDKPPLTKADMIAPDDRKTFT